MTYRIDDGNGNELTVGLSDREEALRVAQRMADDREETVYVSRDVEGSPTTTVHPRTLDSAHIALESDGYSISQSSTDDTLYLAVAVDPNDESVEDDQLASIRAIVEPLGCAAEYTGNGNTDARGVSTSDVRVTVADIHCDCGEITGEPCQWTGPRSDTVLVEYMPEHLRASHKAARNRGTYPANGAIRVRCERSCAERIVADDGEWAEIVD